MPFSCAICNTYFDDCLVSVIVEGHKICKGCVKPDRTQPVVDEKSDGVQLLYKNADLHENAQLAISGKNIREILALLESKKHGRDHGAVSVVIVDGKGGTRLFVPEKDR